MGMVVDKARITGIYGSFTTSKSGKHFLAIVSPGPKIDKVRVEQVPAIPENVVFGTPVNVAMLEAEQKFQDFNGSFSTAKAVQVLPVK
ncbi:hypothetical protein F6V25_05160 [Oryzomonas japonica]|uniref:Uncharacterized protein n=1 Tax=Oryzomonas japonica TaxID=2603858 RepID=A0A7J4ZUA2_9BACT|nr:hypothetical protein [Oryzomonas japonica]KAB0666805.1 hypothetical protein F6V25_05160 [Oryzomonas japonica]